MPIYQLNEQLVFPDPNMADDSGILAIGGDLIPERLLLAYRNGIFPWYSDGEPITWWSPDPRMVLYLEELNVSRSTRKFLRKNLFNVTFDQDFKGVINSCKQQKRIGQEDTWITGDMLEAYIKMHELGYAHSVEVWLENELVGGIYGISLGACFCGESMFSKISNASKTGFIGLVNKIKAWGFLMIDCQVYTEHLASLGAREIPRIKFLEDLRDCQKKETLENWQNGH